MPARDVRALPSCNLTVHRDVFTQVGYFPDFMKSEDTLFCEKVVQNGDRIAFRPEARMVHHNRTRFQHYIKNQISLGEGSRESRRREKLHGHFLARIPFLVPFIPVYRTLIIGKRLILSDRKLFLRYLLLYPLIFAGMVAYTWGFIRGPYRSGLSTEKREETP